MYWDGCLPEFFDLLGLPSEKNFSASLDSYSLPHHHHVVNILGLLNFFVLLHLFKLANPIEITSGAFSCFILCAIFTTSYCFVLYLQLVIAVSINCKGWCDTLSKGI